MRAALLLGALALLALVPGCALVDGLTGAICDEPRSFQDVNQTIPDNNPTGISSSVTAGFGTVDGVTLSSDTSHPYPSDLVYTLSHNGFNVLLDGNGEQDVTDFDGMSAGGLWTMTIYDNRGADEGFWYSWEMAICVL